MQVFVVTLYNQQTIPFVSETFSGAYGYVGLHIQGYVSPEWVDGQKTSPILDRVAGETKEIGSIQHIHVHGTGKYTP